MTWKNLKDLIDGLLTKDSNLPQDSNVSIELLRMAMWSIAETADTIKLEESLDENGFPALGAIRQQGIDTNIYIRKFNLPETDNDDIDIDDELIFAVARLICGYIASTVELKMFHMRASDVIVERFNKKVSVYREDAYNA